MPKVDEKVLEKLSNFAKSLYEQIRKGEEPKIRIPTRTLSNVYFDQEKGLILLGDRCSYREFLNIGHAKKFMQTMLLAQQVFKLIQDGIPAYSKRQLFYSLKRTLPGTKENTFDEQRESDAIIEDLEAALNLVREEMHIISDPKGVFAGPLVLYDRRNDVEIDGTRAPMGGVAIPPIMEPGVIDIVSADADFVLVIEKLAEWQRFYDEKFHKKYNCIIITGKGQADRATRRLVHRLAYEFNLPVYVLTDADPWGYYIYSVFKQGSINLSYISPKLATPKARFLGLTVSDIDYFDIPPRLTLKLRDIDEKRIKEILRYPWFQHKEWQKELQLMLKRRTKWELEALVGKHFRFITDEYVPTKLEKGMFLP